MTNLMDTPQRIAADAQSTAAATAPRLSVVVTTRNDNYRGNVRQRFQTFLDHLGAICDRQGLDAELIVVEWNPEPGFAPLREAVRWPKARRLRVRVVTVPTELHWSFDNSDSFPLFQMIAKNVGVRRAEGQFVLATNVDVLFSEELAAWLARGELDPEAIYRIDRHDIGETHLPEGLDVPARLAFCRQHVVRVHGQYGTRAPDESRGGDPDKLHTEACGDFTLMSRERWLALRGYPEFHLWSIYIDGLLLHAARASGMPQVVLKEPLRLYHIEHESGWAVDTTTIRQFPSLDYHKDYIPLCREMLENRRPLNVNSPSWGLGDQALAEWRPAGGEARDAYRHWVDILSYLDKRLYYRDQTEESLAALEALAREYNPTLIVELGTLGGLSLRAWTRAAPGARITAVDLSFKTLYESTRILPLDLSRVSLREEDILAIDFPSLWGAQDRVLFFVDAHDLPNVPIMRHVLDTALPALPAGSRVVVDDLWYSPVELNATNVREFLDQRVKGEIDWLQCFEAHYAPYHGGGSFLGFREVVPLLEYVNARKIELIFDGQAKNASFIHAPAEPAEDFDRAGFEARCGVAPHNPLDDTLAGDDRMPRMAQRIASIYRQAGAGAAEKLLVELAGREPGTGGLAYALAVCQARQGRPREAMDLLRAELKRPSPHPRAAMLLADLTEKFLTQRDDGRARARGLTIFAMPKAFVGHVGDIQRNAIRSWTRLSPRPKIILFGDEPGIAEIAAEHGLIHEPHVGRNDCGTPLVDALFGAAQKLSRTDVLAYVNADVVLFDDFPAATAALRGRLVEFLMVGRRLDYDQIGPIDFSRPDWAERLRRDVAQNGILHAETGIDYFVFTSGLWPKIPPFAIGRTAWDNWLVMAPHGLGKAVVDGTAMVTAVHQTHDYNHRQGGKAFIYEGIEARRNRLLCGAVDARGFTSGATWALASDGGLARRAPQPVAFASQRFKDERLAWLLKQAKRLLAAKRFDLAEAKFEEALGIKPDHPEITVLRELARAKAATVRPAAGKPAAAVTDRPDPRIEAGARPDKPQDKPAETLRFLQVHTFYAEYLNGFYGARPELATADFETQSRALVEDGFSAIHMVAPCLAPLGYEARLIVANDPRSQGQWARENGRVQSPGAPFDLHGLVRAQIEAYRPQVLYLSDPVTFDGRFLRSLGHRPELVLGWRAADVPDAWDLAGFDLMLSSLEGIRRLAEERGAVRGEPFHPGFPRRMFERTAHITPEADVVFAGQVNVSQYARRNRLLSLLAEGAGRGGFSCRLHLSGPRDQMPPELAAENRGAVFGMDMHRALRAGRIVFDGRGEIGQRRGEGRSSDLAGRETANMRIFEATGLGRFLLTEHFDNLARLYAPGREIETYASEAELLDKVRYYLAHPEAREAIAEAGRERCQRDHSMEVRVREFDALVRRQLEARRGQGGAAGERPPEVRSRPVPVNDAALAARLERLARLNPGPAALVPLMTEVMARLRALVAAGDWTPAAGLVAAAKALRHPVRDLDLLRARIFQGQGDAGAAREALKEELRHFPDNAAAQESLAPLLSQAQVDTSGSDPELAAIMPVIQHYTMVVPAHLASLFALARQACLADIPGNFAECGVAAGGTSALLAWVIARYSRRPRLLYCCDTFSGMPDPGRYDVHAGKAAKDTGWGAGTCAAPQDSLREACRALKVEHLIRPVPGLFKDTLPRVGPEMGELALLHMDSDWYESTRDILDNLWDRVVPGGLIQIDDFGFWDGCRKALEEFAAQRRLALTLTPVGSAGAMLRKP